MNFSIFLICVLFAIVLPSHSLRDALDVELASECSRECRILGRRVSDCDGYVNRCGECLPGFKLVENGDICQPLTYYKSYHEPVSVERRAVLEPGNEQAHIDQWRHQADSKELNAEAVADRGDSAGVSTPAPKKRSEKPKTSPAKKDSPNNDLEFIIIVCVCSMAGLLGIIIAAACWWKIHQNAKKAAETDYVYGAPSATDSYLAVTGDRKLAQSAQMYHYQHQKQQMIALEKANGEMKHDASDEDSDVENDEGDYTVYECPGLASTGEMEVRNPLFQEELPSPGAPPGDAVPVSPSSK